MSISINSTQLRALFGLSSSHKQSALSFNRLAASANDAADFQASISSTILQAKSNGVKFANATIDLTKKEAVTSDQLQTVTNLLEKALAIKNEPLGAQTSRLAQDAEAELNAANSNYQNIIRSDPSLVETETFTVVTSGETDVGTSSRSFSTRIAATESLSEVGVSEELSFDKADIEDTIDSLEAAATNLQLKLGSYQSVRSDISQAISQSAESAQALALNTNLESFTADLANRIRTSTDSLLASRSFLNPDLSSLLNVSEEN